MRKGIATPERNGKPSLTIPVKTRNPLEAFNMLRAGHPIDVTAGYYEEQGLISNDFYMLDTVGKLHALAKIRENETFIRLDIQNQIHNIKQQHDEKVKFESSQKSAQNIGGKVPESRANASGGGGESA